MPYERYIFWLREDLSRPELNTCFQKANDRSFNLVRLDSALQERLKDLLPEIEQSLRGDQFGDNFLSEALFTQFMVYINRIFLKSSTAPDRKSYSSDSQVEQLLKYINRNLAEDLSIDSLAGKFFFSKYHMMRKFKEETGYTIHNYIVSKRLLHARSLISQGMPIMKAAQMSGFPGLHYVCPCLQKAVRNSANTAMIIFLFHRGILLADLRGSLLPEHGSYPV